jgi:acetyl esterase/lipase
MPYAKMRGKLGPFRPSPFIFPNLVIPTFDQSNQTQRETRAINMTSHKTTITSDLKVNAAKFDPTAVSEETVKVKAVLENITNTGAKWHTVGPAEYRKMRDEGKTALPPPVYLPAARDIEIPSRDQGRVIPVRIYEPENGLPSKGIILHCHGGGFVLLSHNQ